MEFRDALKMLRNELGLAQADIAAALHINIATVGRWEQGKNVPNRSCGIALLDYAKSKRATGECVSTLENALRQATKKKLFSNRNALSTEECAPISRLADTVTYTAAVRECISAQREQLEDLLNNTPGGIAIVEVDAEDIAGSFLVTCYNDRFISFSGYDRSEIDAMLRNHMIPLVFNEDVSALRLNIAKICAGEPGTSEATSLRCRTKDGGFRWLRLTGQLSEKRGDICVINFVMTDITESREAIDRQRINEEMLRIAAETDQRSIIVYDIKNNTCRAESRTLFSARYGEVFENIPQSLIDMGLTTPESEGELRALFTRIGKGEKEVCVSLQLHSGPDRYEWFECNAVTVFDAEGLPDHAILVFHNITKQRIKEAVFIKWQQSIAARPVESYTLFRCNLTENSTLDEQDGNLLKISFPSEDMTFNERTKLYAEEYVFSDDREEYTELLDSDALLSKFYRGEHFALLDYRENAENGDVRWRRLTVETVEYPTGTDIEAFLLYEDIDEEKRAEIAALELAKSDPLTGALNRGAFTEKVNDIIDRNPDSCYALIVLDMDGFKKLNETFGYAAGDQALQEIVAVLRSYTRNGDLVCRLGGDGFMVWLHDVPYDAAIGKTAQQICSHICKAYSQDVSLSANAGIAVYPRDGHSYEELYQNADKALYKVKQTGNDSYSFFSVTDGERYDDVNRALPSPKPSSQAIPGVKHRILIVDDNETNRLMLKNIFKDEYLTETAKNGSEAIVRLHRFGTSISVVLLNLTVPGIDGFTVLKRIRNDASLCAIPVIVITEKEEHETLLKAFDLGAADYAVEPVDIDIIRMRMKAVISKAENEHLRAQNSYLMLQRNEEVKYRTVLESTGTVVIEYDRRNHVYIYDREISKHIAGNYNHRGLWQIFQSDNVADSADIKALQDMLLYLIGNKKLNNDSRLVKLKTPQGAWHWFRINVYKNADDSGLADKLLITFNDVHEEVLANDKLLFQATRDELTGLYNRAGFLGKAAELINAEEPGHYVMSCIDVEKFQIINDRFGTEKGDGVLKHIASAVGSFVHQNNGICCRYAADKFAVLYPAKLLDTAELEESHKLSSSPDCIPRPIHLRIGRCLVNDTSLPVSAMFDRAAMAESLAKGRYNTYIVDYDESMRDNILKEQQIVGDMVEALQNGEFEPWFQPQYNHSTGALIGAEALVRWRNNGKIILPKDFIPIFEKNGFIYELDQFIWRQVCALLRRWLDEGKKPLPISVNISRNDMFQESFVDVITGLVAEYRLPVELLSLELTESAFCADTATITGIAGKLITAGFTVEIDDFGSGYSSLNTLKDVPASILKLDMCFFERTGDAKRGGNIVESVVRMAKWLGMAVIAEGVEDKAQADYLKSIGCFYIQGYLYAKPMPVAQYEKLLDTDEKEVHLIHLQTLQNLDNNDFWNSRSMDTLIFNSYVGAACILELSKSGLEMLRSTEHFMRMLHSSTLDINDVLSIDWLAHMDSQNISLFTNAVQKSLETKENVIREFEFHNLPGCPKKVILRSSLRVIATVGERHLIYCLNDNITAQREAEREALKASERVNAVMNNSHSGISAVIARPDGTVELLFVNNRFFELLGYTREQYTAEVKSPYDRVFPEDRDRIFDTVTKLTEIGSTLSLEVRELRRDNSVVWLRCDISVIRFADVSEPVQLSSFLDITEQKINDLKQLESARQLEGIMSNVNSGISAIYIKEDKLEYVIANEQYYGMFGYTEEEFKAEGINTFDLLYPDDRERVIKKIVETQEYGERYTVEYRIIRRDGAVRNILCNASVLQLFGTDEPLHLTVSNDITELREAQRKENAIKNRLNTVMNAMSNGMTAVVLHGDKVEFLFANNRYYEIHGLRVGDIGDEYLNDVLSRVAPEDRDKLRNSIYEAAKAESAVSVEYKIRHKNGIIHWVRATISMTKLADIDEPVQVAVFSDITDEKKSNEQLRFLNESAGEILTQPDSEKAINDTLRKMLVYFASERAYVFELNDNAKTSVNTYECCAPGITSEKAKFQGFPYEIQRYWFEAFNRVGFVAIPDVSAMNKKSEAAMRALLTEHNIRSIIVAPLWRDGKLIGFIGIDNPTKELEQISQLIALTDYITVLLTRRDLMKTVEYGRQRVQQLIDDAPGGFLRLQILPDSTPVIVSLNSGFCRILGMTSDEVMTEYGSDAHKCLVTEDIATVKDAAAEALVGNGLYNYKCRLKKKDGTAVWVQVYGRYAEDENGKLFRNSYFTDITEQRSKEQLQSELLDNLPFGAAMYDYDGKALTVIHINKSHRKLVKRNKNADGIDAVHPDDRVIVLQELDAAIRQKRNPEVNCRILCGNGTYLPFHLAGTVTPSENGHWILYLASSPIKKDEMSIQEMLPIALSTVISSSADMSCIKDKDLRYICASPSIAEMAGAESPRDLVGKSSEEVFGKEFAAKFSDDDRHVIETGKAVIHSLEYIPATDGGVRMLQTSKYPILNASGQVIGIYCVCQDITAQKENELQLKLLTDTIPGGLASYSVSKAGIKTLYFNDGLFGFSGYTREEYTNLTQKEPLALLFDEDREKIRDMIRTFATQKQDGMIGTCNYRCHTKGGQTRNMSLKAVLMQLAADRYVLNIVQFDMTNQVEIEQRMKSLLDNLPFGAAMYEFDGESLKALHINKQYQLLVGRIRNSATEEGYSPTDFIHPDDRIVALNSIRDAIANHRDASCNIRVLYGEDEYRSVHIDARIVAIPDGKYLVYVAYTRISEQELTFENALPHMFSTIMESSTDLAFAKDIDFRYICCSKTFATLLGLENEKDVVGKTDYELFPKAIADMFRQDDSELFATQKPQIDIEEIIPSPNGTKHYIRTSKHLLRNNTDTVIGIYCTGRDITEVQEAYAKLRLLTDSIPGGIATFRCSSDNIEPTYFNDGVCELAGYTREEYDAHPVPLSELVFDEDRQIIRKNLELLKNGKSNFSFTVRIHTKNGGYKWVNGVAAGSDRVNDVYNVNVVLTDITEHKEEQERLRLAEEEYRIATIHSGHTIGRYDIASQTLTLSEETADKLALPELIPDVPYGRVKLGKISKATEKEYIAFYEKIMHGEKDCSVIFQKLLTNGWRWISERATTIFDENGKPISAIISYSDVTEQQEKETVYKKWQQNLTQKRPESFTLFRCNLNLNSSYDTVEGKLLNIHTRWDEADARSFNERTRDFVEDCVVKDDWDMYLRFVNSDTMLASYYRGKRSSSIEFRGLIATGDVHWIRLSVELVEYPNTKDIAAYLMYEDINDSKLAELDTQIMAETDPLTGLLNRKTFIERMDGMLAVRKGNALYALLLIDVDRFKLVNDSFGHAVGDKLLIDISGAIKSVLRESDLVCRLGGDEFLVCMSTIPNRDVILKKAKRILELMHNIADFEVQLSVSAGIAVCPDDGNSFEALYPKVDKALYHIKSHGKDNCAFYDTSMKTALISTDEPILTSIDTSEKPTVLIVDNRQDNINLMTDVFEYDFKVETAKDGASALSYLRRNNEKVSVILLEMKLPDMDGFGLLKQLHESEMSADIPVVAVSDMDEREAALNIIKAGASDFVTKPLDPTLLRIRVESAVSKAENERLRARNRMLSLLKGQEKQE